METLNLEAGKKFSEIRFEDVAHPDDRIIEGEIIPSERQMIQRVIKTALDSIPLEAQERFVQDRLYKASDTDKDSRLKVKVLGGKLGVQSSLRAVMALLRKKRAEAALDQQSMDLHR